MKNDDNRIPFDLNNFQKREDNVPAVQVKNPFEPNKDLMELIARPKKERLLREIENNKNLKELVDYNEKILNKINSLDETLAFLNNSLNKKSEFDKKKANEQTALLLELAKIIEEKDNNKLEKFMNNVGTPLGVGLVTEYLKMKLGLS
ncbi:hypothetical protein KCK34_001615 [Clostridium perfringens]|uniref:hypothetical protein n=1 Tax=Clostridium perfringens TaxID=1502 RepID=UPI001DA56BCB|nr:hypothetical protein [Clostridium perfringens]EHK2335176.1 hypothetical protein [Clostridium perfringens]